LENIQPFVDDGKGAVDQQCYYNPDNYGEVLTEKKYNFALAFVPVFLSCLLFVIVPIVWVVIRMRRIMIKDSQTADVDQGQNTGGSVNH